MKFQICSTYNIVKVPVFYRILFQSIFPICSCCNLTCSNFWAVIFPLQFTVAMDELLDFHLAFIMSISYFIFISHKYFNTSQLFSRFKSLKCCTIFYWHHKMPVPLAAAIIERIKNIASTFILFLTNKSSFHLDYCY